MTSSNQQLLNPYRRLRAGCYFMRFTPAAPYWGEEDNSDDAERGVEEYEGTLRVVHYSNDGARALSPADIKAGRQGQVVNLSGDLYAVPPSQTTAFQHQIPIYPRSDYRFYLLATEINERGGQEFAISLMSQELTPSGWKNRGTMTAFLQWASAPDGSPSPFDYLEGPVWDLSGNYAGNLTLSWTSEFLRRAVIEFDRVNDVRIPFDNFSQVEHGLQIKDSHLTWQNVFQRCGWNIEVAESDQPAEPASKTWSEAELRQVLPVLRDSADLDREWRYQIFCVGRLEDGGRGYQFNVRGIEPNSSLFESVVIAAKYEFPRSAPYGEQKDAKEEWGSLAGKILENTPAYFRTAVHEVGHALRLEHNFSTLGFMATTDSILQEALKPSKPSDPLDLIAWEFAPDDLERLRHWPDIVLRPGGQAPKFPLPGIDSFRFLQLSGGEEDNVQPPPIEFTVTPLLEEVPLGAPVRIKLELANETNEDFYAPKLRLKSGNITGFVELPSGEKRPFSPIAQPVDDLGLERLPAGQSLTGALTLLRGPNGSLFPSTGTHVVTVELRIRVNGRYFTIAKSTPVWIAPFTDNKHLRVANLLLNNPNTLLGLALGDETAPDANQAINLALNNPTLAPHFAIVRLRRLCRGIGRVPGYLDETLRILASPAPSKPILTPAEVGSLIKLMLPHLAPPSDSQNGSSRSLSPYWPNLRTDWQCIGLRILLGDRPGSALPLADQISRPQKQPPQTTQETHPAHTLLPSEEWEMLLRDRLGVAPSLSRQLTELLLRDHGHRLPANPSDAKPGSPRSPRQEKLGLPPTSFAALQEQFAAASKSYPFLLAPASFAWLRSQILDAFRQLPMENTQLKTVLLRKLETDLRSIESHLSPPTSGGSAPRGQEPPEPPASSE